MLVGKVQVLLFLKVQKPQPSLVHSELQNFSLRVNVLSSPFCCTDHSGVTVLPAEAEHVEFSLGLSQAVH